MPRIEISEPVRGRYRAELAGNPRLSEFGNSVAEALGNLVCAFPCTLGLSLNIQKADPRIPPEAARGPARYERPTPDERPISVRTRRPRVASGGEPRADAMSGESQETP